MKRLTPSAGRYRHVVFVDSRHGSLRTIASASPQPLAVAPPQAVLGRPPGSPVGRPVGFTGRSDRDMRREVPPAPACGSALSIGGSDAPWGSEDELSSAASARGSRSDPILIAEEREFISWLFGGAGLVVNHYKTETMRRRLPACLRAARARSIREARSLLEHAPRLRQAALSALVIGVTHFFRDAVFFSALAGQVLPDLVTSATRRRLRVWSVGCSSGAELYSVAMLLAEHGVLDRCQFLGTDCRGDAIEQARAGVYEAAALSGVPANLRDRYFTPVDRAGSRWVAAPALRESAHWRTGNALTVSEPGAWDLILCRNVAIYLQPDAAAALWRRLEASLCTDGVLALGKAERPTGTSSLMPVGPCLYRLAAPAQPAEQAQLAELAELAGGADEH